MSKFLFTNNDWDFPMLARFLEVCEEIGTTDLGMKLYPNQLEIISSAQMLDAYTSVGMPVMYNHWSFGKRHIRDSQRYQKGHMGLAYEIVLNSNPAIAYLMEENSAMMQLLVIAHASIGHNFVFSNNYLFKQWTDADAIIDYLKFAKMFIAECEEKYGVAEVERILDSCHALQDHGVDKYSRGRLNPKREKERLKERLAEWDRTQSDFWYHMDVKGRDLKPQERPLLQEPEENLLYFLEKNSPVLKSWQREIVRIVRKVSQYFYPQRLSKTLNEGCLVAGSLIRTDQGLVDIKDISENRLPVNVWDGEQYQPVYDWFKHENKPRIKITTKQGHVVHGGADHRIFTNNMWVKLSDFSVGDTVDCSSQSNYTGDRQDTIVDIAHDIGTTYDFSVQNTHRYASGPFLHHNCATFTHHYILNKLYDEDRITNGHQIEWMASHSGVIYQPPYDSKGYSGINPYTLGFNIFRDIRRICENPTDEDRQWFPKLVGKDWRETVREAATEYRDDSFIQQFLSPTVTRQMKLFSIVDDKSQSEIEVDAIHNPETFDKLRYNLACSYDLANYEPQILVVNANMEGDRTLSLEHRRVEDRDLDKNTRILLNHIHRLWGYSVVLRSVSPAGNEIHRYST
jgi:spore cortex formation protein SpoVR/YcgB (stage V sporulation)